MERLNQERLIESVQDNQFKEAREWWYTDLAETIAELFDPATSTSILEQLVWSMRVWEQRDRLPEDLVEEHKEILLGFGILGERG